MADCAAAVPKSTPHQQRPSRSAWPSIRCQVSTSSSMVRTTSAVPRLSRKASNDASIAGSSRARFDSARIARSKSGMYRSEGLALRHVHAARLLLLCCIVSPTYATIRPPQAADRGSPTRVYRSGSPPRPDDDSCIPFSILRRISSQSASWAIVRFSARHVSMQTTITAHSPL